MTPFDPRDLAIAKANGALTDLQMGERVKDGEGERAVFLSYGDNAPIYVNLRYQRAGVVRIPNSELRRA
jgi:hypothetical protein